MTTHEAYRKLAEMTRHADSELLIKIFSRAMSPEEAEFLLALPAANDDLAIKFNLKEDAVEERIQELMKRGLVVPSRKGARFPRDLSFIRDEMLSSSPEFIPPELPGLWKELYEREWRDELAEALSAVEFQALRVLPAQKAVPPDVELLPWEDVGQIIGAAKSVAVRDCACRIMMKGCQLPVHTCMQFNRRADYSLGRGGSKQVTVEEVRATALSSEDAGVVPIVANIGAMERLDYICYCCDCCCSVLDPLKRVERLHEGLAKSRFMAVVDQDACTGCQTCVERCHFDAIEMVKVPGAKKLKAAVDPEKCFGCGLCVLTCEDDALTLKLERPPEHIPGTHLELIP
ncbi:ATP-binding protein [Thermodesulfobacteriota bacterium]